MNVNQSQPDYGFRQETQGRRNTFDLSHAHVDTFKMGELVPYFIKEVIPNDYIRLKSEFFFRFPPMHLPTFHRVNFQCAVFYVPNRILWPGRTQDSWEWFIRDESSVEAPYIMFPTLSLIDFSGAETWRTTVAEHMGVPSMQTSIGVSVDAIKLNALPFSALLMIWDEYYRNDQIQGARWFELTGGDNSTGMQAAFPQKEYTAETQYYLCLRRNWNKDLFTTCTPSPQVGANTLVPIMRNNSVDIGTWSYLGPTNWKFANDNTQAHAGPLTVSVEGQTLSDGEGPIYLDIQETSASIRDLRYAVMLTEYLEKLMRVGDRYRDFIKGFWSVDPFPLLVDRPLYLGGKTGLVTISEVMSHAETLNGDNEMTAAVGSYAGQAIARDNSGSVAYHCSEHGFVIGLVCVYPKTSYFQGLERMWTRENKYDYPFDQFALIGDDAVLHKDVMYSFLLSDEVWNGGIFGYNRRYFDWTYANSIVSGQMRDSQGPLFSFHLARFFDVNDSAGLNLNGEFLECVPDAKRVFEIADEDEEEVYAYIWNECHVQRQLPKYGIPALR